LNNFLHLQQALWQLAPPLTCTFLICITVSLLHKSIGNLTFKKKTALFFMSGVFGTSIGSIIGATESGEISTITTAIITLGSGYLTYLTSKEEKIDQAIKQLLPGGLVSLLLCMLISLFYMNEYLHPQSKTTHHTSHTKPAALSRMSPNLA
jgi:FtsH-binding integral membrane protein